MGGEAGLHHCEGEARAVVLSEDYDSALLTTALLHHSTIKGS